ncbi:MAG: amidohydrolase family protein, partial [Dehalococcoidia bacterium]
KPRARDLYPHHMESIQKALKAGVRVVAGTDAGGWGHPMNAGELRCMVEEAGMTPMQVLMSATGLAAQCLGMEKEIGTVEKGKLADLVVVDGDPLQDIKVLLDKARIKMVLKGGQVHADRRAETGVKAAAG